MPRPGPMTQSKRAREAAQRTKQKKKAERREERKELKAQRSAERRADGQDPDIAGIIPGPQRSIETFM